MHLSGQLSDWSISDLLQIMQVTKKTGSLDIEGERQGRIHFRDGTVTGAELKGPTATGSAAERREVADVLYVLSTLTAGSFAVGPADGPDSEGWAVEDVLGDVAELKGLENEVHEVGLFDAAALRLVADVGEPITIGPRDWAVLVSLVQPFTFDELEISMGRGGAVRVLHALHRMGVAEVAPSGDDDESNWLDSLAGDIAPESTEPPWFETDDEEGEDESGTEAESPVEQGAESQLEIHAPLADLPRPAPGDPSDLRGVSAPASTTLTDGVYDEIRRLRSKVAEK